MKYDRFSPRIPSAPTTSDRPVSRERLEPGDGRALTGSATCTDAFTTERRPHGLGALPAVDDESFDVDLPEPAPAEGTSAAAARTPATTTPRPAAPTRPDAVTSASTTTQRPNGPRTSAENPASARAAIPATNPNSLLHRHFTDDVKKQLAVVRSTGGFGLDDVVRSGLANPDSSIGVYAPEANAYPTFAPLFAPIIEDYHGHSIATGHTTDLSPMEKAPPLDPSGKYIASTRVRVGRNLEGFPFAPGISKDERHDVEDKVVGALKDMPPELQGHYFPLVSMTDGQRTQLIEDHFLFKEGDRFLEAAGANRDWPTGRGIFHSEDKRFLTWVNEEDQLRIISMQEGSDLEGVYGRLLTAVDSLERKLAFAKDDALGHLSSCPTNLGTAMRASVHIRLPKISSSSTEFKSVCEELGLSIRGVHGEHSESEGGLYDISNKHRLGVSERECLQTLHEGVRRLIELEETSGT